MIRPKTMAWMKGPGQHAYCPKISHRREEMCNAKGLHIELIKRGSEAALAAEAVRKKYSDCTHIAFGICSQCISEFARYMDEVGIGVHDEQIE